MINIIASQFQNSEVKAVSIKSLVELLGIETPHTQWFQRQVEKYGFTEQEEFITLLGKTSESGGRPQLDYIVPIDVAKELCMIANSEKGKQVRKYFIECEKQIQEKKLPGNYIEALKALVVSEEENLRIASERDEAIRTKHMIGDTKVAKALGKVGGLTTANTHLKLRLDDTKGKLSIAERYIRDIENGTDISYSETPYPKKKKR